MATPAAYGCCSRNGRGPAPAPPSLAARTGRRILRCQPSSPTTAGSPRTPYPSAGSPPAAATKEEARAEAPRSSPA
ncbi:hypothetical protein Zm00014a_041749 [Zea mays]|uniref:Uncharacterized protein n=1 Tax=Zea mays TaxID=4577 RepID=A0A3L6EE22_MAIZE|nr:hypothetical protein Zm00014a_041749 [Zea mays]